MSRCTLQLTKPDYTRLVEAGQQACKENRLKSLNQQERKVLKTAVHLFRDDANAGRVKNIYSQTTVDTIIEKLKTNSGQKKTPIAKRFFRKIGNAFHFRIGVNSLHKSIQRTELQGFKDFYNQLSSKERNYKVKDFKDVFDIVASNKTDQEKFDAMAANKQIRGFLHIETTGNWQTPPKQILWMARNGLQTVGVLSQKHGAAIIAKEMSKTDPCFEGTITDLLDKYPDEVIKASIYLPNLDPVENEDQRIGSLINAFQKFTAEKILSETKKASPTDEEVIEYCRDNYVPLNYNEFSTWSREYRATPYRSEFNRKGERKPGWRYFEESDLKAAFTKAMDEWYN